MNLFAITDVSMLMETYINTRILFDKLAEIKN